MFSEYCFNQDLPCCGKRLLWKWYSTRWRLGSYAGMIYVGFITNLWPRFKSISFGFQSLIANPVDANIVGIGIMRIQ